jgi:feruloyl esterase
MRNQVIVIMVLTAAARLDAAFDRAACKQILYEFSRPRVTLVTSAIVENDRDSSYCRVTGTILPDVGFEAQLPLEWNGRFYMVDNAGSGGRINHRRMSGARAMGYATASTDQGYNYRTEGDSRYGYNNRQKEIDFGFRSLHVTTETAQGIIEAFYDRPAAYSYFVGSSAGGRQAMMEAQRFPDDYDGILVGAPTLNISKIQMWGLWKAKALSGEGYISPEHMPALAKAVYDGCDFIALISKRLLFPGSRPKRQDPCRELVL